MSTKPFHYQDPFPLKKDDTEYYLLTRDHVSVTEFEGHEILKVEPQALTLLAQQAFHDASFMLRPAHQQQVADILADPEASENDRYVALQFLRNPDIAAKGILPTCQDTGTAIISGKKGQRVWTGGGDENALARGVYNTYIEDNLRYSQNAALDMYREVNTGTNLPAQIDLYSVDGDEYKFLCIAKGGGSANKTYLYQETKALLTPGKLKDYLVDKMRTLGTAACPPYHIAFVIGGTSAEATLKTVKLASTHYYDSLPTSGNEHGQAFRDLALEQELLGLKAGDKHAFTLEPEAAFGAVSPDLIQYFSRRDFINAGEPEIGAIMLFTGMGGSEMPGVIREISGDSITVDFNHPLAGHQVHFDIDVLEVNPALGANDANPAG